MLKHVISLIVAILAVSIGFAPSASAKTDTVQLSCLSANWPRPTSSGTYRDPCLDTRVVETHYRVDNYVNIYWNCSGGCHVTDIQAVTTFCKNSELYTRVQVDKVNLGRADPESGVIGTTLTAENSGTAECVTNRTPWVPVVGCGSYERTTNGYNAQMHSWVSARKADAYGGGLDYFEFNVYPYGYLSVTYYNFGDNTYPC